MAPMGIGRLSICGSEARVPSRLFASFPLQLGRLYGLYLQEDVFRANRAKLLRRIAVTLVVDCSIHPNLARGKESAIIQWASR